MRNAKLGKPLFVRLAIAALMALFVLTGCSDDDEEMDSMVEEMGYQITVTNGLSAEKLAPIVVARASDDDQLFTSDNYVTAAAEDQILRGWPCMVLDAIGEGNATSNHLTDMQPQCMEENKVTVAASEPSEPIMFDTNATALRILAMVAPSAVPDHYVSAVVNVAGLMSGESIMAPLSRFDIGDDEGTMDIARVDDIGMIGVVTITRR